MLDGIKSARPNLLFYTGSDDDLKPGFEGVAQRSELRQSYADLPCFSYEFKLGLQTKYFTFSYLKKLPNAFLRQAWNNYEFIEKTKN